jgi:hypothetical protein
MDNIVWLIMIGIILCILGWGSLLVSCHRENKKNEESLLLGV